MPATRPQSVHCQKVQPRPSCRRRLCMATSAPVMAAQVGDDEALVQAR
jgi:hypothetical protein